MEAKRTSVDPKKGKQQAKLYVDCLEAMYAQRPVIFYSLRVDRINAAEMKFKIQSAVPAPALG